MVNGMDKKSIESTSEYDWCLEDIKKYESKIDVLVEVGSRDGLDAIKIAKNINSKQNIIFEADPNLIQDIETNIKNYGGNIKFKLLNLALGDEDKEVNFFAVDQSKYSNKGVGSLYKIDFDNREKKDPDYKRKDVQKIIKLNQNKYTSLNLPIPDLLLIDVEGAEYEVLKGFDIDLSKIKFIVLESSISKNHVGAKTFINNHKLLKKHFKLISNSRHEKNFNLFIDHYKYKLSRNKMYSPAFDLFYVNKSIKV